MYVPPDEEAQALGDIHIEMRTPAAMAAASSATYSASGAFG